MQRQRQTEPTDHRRRRYRPSRLGVIPTSAMEGGGGEALSIEHISLSRSLFQSFSVAKPDEDGSGGASLATHPLILMRRGRKPAWPAPLPLPARLPFTSGGLLPAYPSIPSSILPSVPLLKGRIC